MWNLEFRINIGYTIPQNEIHEFNPKTQIQNALWWFLNLFQNILSQCLLVKEREGKNSPHMIKSNLNNSANTSKVRNPASYKP